MRKPRKPAAIARGPLKAHPRKPPTASDGRWYWQVIYYEDRKQKSARHQGKSAHRRGTPAQIRAHLDTVLEGDWRQPQQATRKLPEIITVGAVCRLWLVEMRQRRDRERIKPDTYRNAHAIIKLHLVGSSIESIPVDRLTRAIQQRWINEQQDAGAAPRTVALRWRTLRAALRWGRDHGYTPPHLPPAPELPKVDGYIYSHTTPTRAQILQAIDELTGWRRSLVVLLLGTGARVGEVAHLDWTAWSRPDRALTLFGKTGARTIPTNSTVHQTLTEMWMEAGQPIQGRVFPVRKPSAIIRKNLLKYGINPHGIRRRVSSQLIEAGVDVKAYEALMGHSYALALKVYAQANPSRIAAAADLLG